LFVLCYGFLISFLFHFLPVLYTQSIFLSPHYASAICKTQQCWATMLFPPIVLLWIYLITYCTFFPFLSPTWLMQTLSCASSPHVSEFLPTQNASLQSCTDYYTPPPPATPTNPNGWHHATENITLPTVFLI
jgi:hypothetical protein